MADIRRTDTEVCLIYSSWTGPSDYCIFHRE